MFKDAMVASVSDRNNGTKVFLTKRVTAFPGSKLCLRCTSESKRTSPKRNCAAKLRINFKADGKLGTETRTLYADKINGSYLLIVHMACRDVVHLI